MGTLTFWRTPEWFASRDARGSSVAGVKIPRYALISTVAEQAPSAVIEPIQESTNAAADGERIPQLPQQTTRSQA